MAAIHDLLAQIQDEALRERIEKEVNKLSKTKKFGLVFEEHLPECTPLYDMPIKVGCNVMLRNTKEDKSLYLVLKIDNEKVICGKKDNIQEQTEFELNEIVRVAEFGEPIYPYLKPLDSVCNAPDSDLWHTLIEADNYHALQLLEYLYAGKVDCIYIDPPYNTGAKDWKYNNDYVDNTDVYRHSKWLSMMQKRLKLAKKLLNPDDSAMIITIDEKEYHHLACMLEELFPEASIQMISTVINHAGNGRLGDFGRVNEYIYYVRLGACQVQAHDEKVASSNEVVWDTLRRHNPASIRPNRPNQFYPIYIDIRTKKIVKIGDPIAPEIDRFSVPSIEGCETVFPVKDNGTEMMWGVIPEECRRRAANGYVKIGKYNPNKPQQFPLQMLTAGVIKEIEEGTVKVIGHREDGSVIAIHPEGKKVLPKNQWDKDTHDARYYGTELIRSIIGDRFSYPKSLYAVTDSLRYILSGKKDALVVDFFAGSGTTLHAVNLLNLEDDGKRRCILVTNNEVSVEESKTLTEQGYKPGDAEWDKLGIAQFVTWPRLVCSIKGVDINGKALKGNYTVQDRPMSEGFFSNVKFFKLGFLDKTAVALGLQFKEMLPTLWMKAGAIGKCPELEGDALLDMLILPENKFAVLINENSFAQFEEELSDKPEIQTVYLITDYEVNYRSMAKSLGVETTYQLYRDYLDNFRINHGRN